MRDCLKTLHPSTEIPKTLPVAANGQSTQRRRCTDKSRRSIALSLRERVGVRGRCHQPFCSERNISIEVIRLSNEDIIGNPDGAWEHLAHVIAVRAGFVRQKNAFDPLHGDNDQ